MTAVSSTVTFDTVRLILKEENGQKTAPLSCTLPTCLPFSLVIMGRETVVTSAYVAYSRTSGCKKAAR